MKSYPGPEGATYHFNDGDRVELIAPISLRDMESALFRFRKLQFDWAVDYLCSVQDIVRNGQPKQMATGLVGQTVSKASTYASYLMRVAQFPDRAWDGLPEACRQPYQRGPHLEALTLEQQQLCIRRACGNDLHDLEAILQNQRHHDMTHLEIEVDLAASRSSADFIVRLEARLDSELRKPVASTKSNNKMSHDVESVYRRSSIIECFLFYLAEQHIALCPLRAKAFAGQTNGFEKYLMTQHTLKLLSEYEGTATIAVRKSAAPMKEGSMIVMRRNRRSYLPIFMMSCDYRGEVVIDSDLFNDVYDAMADKDNAEARQQALRFLQRIVASMTTGKMPAVSLLQRKNTSASRFDWIDLVYDASTAKQFPEYVPSDYRPQPHLRLWADRFLQELKHLQTKDYKNQLAAYSSFVIWLAWSRCTAADITDLRRDDMNDGERYEDSRCFRAFVINKGVSEETATFTIAKIAAFFDRQIERRRLSIANPIILRFDSVKSRVRRGKTPRMPLGRDMMEYIREYNQRDDFAFAKSLSAHYRLIRHPDTGEMKNVWYPAIPIIIDFLLRIPVRSFQARFLDSGEADELLPDFDGKLGYMRNASPMAEKKRKEFVLTFMEGLESQNILGLYINTNKTSIDRDGGYEIPWCDDDISRNILFMRAWQLRYNRISEPVLCVERDKEPENVDAHARIQRCWPLFRDPAELENYPPSRAVLKKYWDDLLSAVEDELAGSGNPVRLTEQREVSKGKNVIVQRIALYDIHTLRVSGITALIESGLPPNMVMSVAGHSTIVMTLYYNRISSSRLNARLAAYMDEARNRLGEDDSEVDQRFLINTREEEDRVGLNMLRSDVGRTGAAIEYMSHGICPGGDCGSGGEWTNQSVGHSPVPRPLACSLCRYRLTGPMFLPGLVCNANRLMFELRSRGEEIANLNKLARSEAKGGRSSYHHSSKVASLYRETDIIAREWIAEIAYVRKCEAMLDDFLAASNIERDDRVDHDPMLPMITGQPSDTIVSRLESKSGFALLQSLSDGAQEIVGFRPSVALGEHRELLNEILMANDERPFLLSLSGEVRDIVANMLGRAITAGVPDEEIALLRTGTMRLNAYPAVKDALRDIGRNALLDEDVTEIRSIEAVPA